jgi:Zn-dependent protease
MEGRGIPLALVRVACIADTNGRPELLALGFHAGEALPEPTAALFGLGFTLNAVPLITNLVPLRALDGGQILAGLKAERVGRDSR